MKRTPIALAIVAVMLVLGMSIGSVWSYFTDTTTVEGTLPLSVQPTTHIIEENDPGTKTIRIQNTSQVTPVWVRVRVYAPAKLGANASGEKWSGVITDWYDYGEPVPAGAETEPLKVTFALPGGYDAVKNVDGAQTGDEVNVVVLYQSLPVSYDAEGNPVPANWND